VLRTINLVKTLVEIDQQHCSIICVYEAQASPHMKREMQEMNADFYSFSGHKMLGPTGIGVLFGKRELLQKMEPIEFGGDMIDFVSKYDATWADLPIKFEAGTPLIAQAIGLAEAIRYLERIGFDAIHKYEQE
ncbi:aminotransferase class V-fold PLP-dependent enzyme, partial [Escherichia coli]|nr:aminotransferase class V-fold PLP-dependent enzyme [Escherichia coli]